MYVYGYRSQNEVKKERIDKLWRTCRVYTRIGGSIWINRAIRKLLENPGSNTDEINW
jgi:hypothetical protein